MLAGREQHEGLGQGCVLITTTWCLRFRAPPPHVTRRSRLNSNSLIFIHVPLHILQLYDTNTAHADHGYFAHTRLVVSTLPSQRVQSLAISAAIYHSFKHTGRTSQEISGRVEFGKPACIQDQNLVRVHDAVQAMRDGENGAALELRSKGMLNDGVCLMIFEGKRWLFWSSALLFFYIPSDAVASSRMRILLRRTSARANATTCRWPTEKLSPALLTPVSSEIRSSSGNSS